MNSQRRRAFVACLLMLVGAAAAVVAKPSKKLADQRGMPDLETLFPEQFGDWQVESHGAVVLPSPNVQAMLDKIYNGILTRNYINSKGARIMLSVAYGGDQSDGTSAHRPEACYPAQGFAITANTQEILEFSDGHSIPVRRLMSKMGSRDEPITYWIVVGNKVVTTGIGQKVAQMRYGLRDVIADGMLVRVSSIDADTGRAYKIHSNFLAELRDSTDATSAVRIFGGGE